MAPGMPSPTAFPRRAGLVQSLQVVWAHPEPLLGLPGPPPVCLSDGSTFLQRFPPRERLSRKPPAICHHDPSLNGSHRKYQGGFTRAVVSHPAQAFEYEAAGVLCAEPADPHPWEYRDPSGCCRRGSSPRSATRRHPSAARALSSQVEMEIGSCLGTKSNKACQVF